MYENPKKTHCKKIRKRTPSYSGSVPRIEVLLWKVTTDEDLEKKMKVCYKDLGGAYTKLGTITDIIEDDRDKTIPDQYLQWSVHADELKLIIEN